jgi:type II secretory ATPase GspE/PulE/Tfp pilus assembly ATPase PilB-like protein
VLEADTSLRDAISEEATNVELRRVARASGGWIPMAEYAGWLLAQGLTVPTEVLRVLPMGDA